MNSEQHKESLLAILTFCESLEKPVYHDLQEEQFGMSKHLFVQTVSDLNQNNVIKAELGIGFVLFFPLTEKGREKLEQLREEQQNQRLLVSISRWLLNNWHYLLPIFKR